MTETTFLSLQTAVAGRFSLERELGRGGMGIVYLAHDVLLERPVAIKLLAPTLGASAEMRRRFVREARIAAQCFHPHIVPIHTVEESGDLAFFVMAYVQGETLADRLHRVGPLQPDMVRRIARDIGWALSYAHERGVIHRDVKPENILIEDGTERALITDFGIALRDDPTRSQSGEVAGTARFMAPEQALGQDVDGRADLYALGVTLYLASTGHHPFEGRSTFAVIAQGDAASVPSVRTRAAALPASLADAIDRCLARRADDRFENAAAFVKAMVGEAPPPPLPPALRPARASVEAARSLLFWTTMVGGSALLLAVGERFDSFTSGIMLGITSAVCGVMATGAGVLGIEAMVRARGALRGGASVNDVMRSLSAEPSVMTGEQHNRWRSLAVVLSGAAIAVAQGPLTRIPGLPDALKTLMESVMIFAPPLLMGRGTLSLWRDSRASNWVRTRIGRPVVSRVAQWLGKGITQPSLNRALPSTAPTEIRLGLAADEILARLSPDLRAELHELPAAAAALAREAESLRQRDAHISAEMRALRVAPTSANDDAVLRVESERVRVRARLATTIAALESIRLDLLRLEAGETNTGNLTAHLDVVRDLQRRVDAADEVRALLRPGVAELT